MCVVLPHILARGPLRAPVQPQARGSSWALNPSRASKTYRRFITRKGAFGAPLHPIRQWAFHSPSEPSTTSWRRFQRDHSHGDLPCAGWMPIRSLATRYPRPNSRRLDRRRRIAAEPRPRAVLGCANQKTALHAQVFPFHMCIRWVHSFNERFRASNSGRARASRKVYRGLPPARSTGCTGNSRVYALLCCRLRSSR